MFEQLPARLRGYALFALGLALFAYTIGLFQEHLQLFMVILSLGIMAYGAQEANFLQRGVNLMTSLFEKLFFRKGKKKESEKRKGQLPPDSGSTGSSSS